MFIYLALMNLKKIDIHIGDQLNLRNIHSSGKRYPYWADFYWIEKRDE